MLGAIIRTLKKPNPFWEEGEFKFKEELESAICDIVTPSGVGIRGIYIFGSVARKDKNRLFVLPHDLDIFVQMYMGKEGLLESLKNQLISGLPYFRGFKVDYKVSNFHPYDPEWNDFDFGIDCAHRISH